MKCREGEGDDLALRVGEGRSWRRLKGKVGLYCREGGGGRGGGTIWSTGGGKLEFKEGRDE